MKKVGLIVCLAAILIIIGVARNENNNREYTTSDQEAYDLYLRGNEHVFAFEYRRATEPLAKALEIDPDFAMAAAGLAIAHRRLGESGPALQHLARADSLSQHIRDDRERMVIQLRLSEFPEYKSAKRDSLQGALTAIDPDNLFLLISRYVDALIANDVVAQEKTCRKMLEVEPNYANAYNLLGYVEYFRGNYSEAITMMRKYIFVAPEIANPHDSLGDVLASIGRYEEAEAEFLQVLKMQPDFFASIINLGRIYIEQGKVRKGIKVLEQVRAEVADTDLAVGTDGQLAFLYFVHPIPEQADSAMAQFISAYPEQQNAAMLRVARMIRHNNLDGAAAVRDSLLNDIHSQKNYQQDINFRNGVDVFEARAIANAAIAVGDYATAATERGKVVQLFSGIPPHRLTFSRIQFAEALIEIDRPEQAMEELNLVLEINPRQIQSLALAVSAQMELDNFQGARKYLAALEKAVSKSDPDYHYRATAKRFHKKLSKLAADS